MTKEHENAKSRIVTAKRLAQDHGVEVLGWNDKPDQESISFNGEDDKLLALQKEMEKLGWHSWPVEEEQEGAFMDFAMRPPPPVTRSKPEKAADEEELAETVMTAKPTFHYAGPGSLFNSQWPVLGGLSALAAFRFWKTPVYSTRIMLAITAFLFVFAALLLCDWVEITAAEGKLTLRKHFFGQSRTIELANLKSAKVFRPTDRRGKRQSEYIHVSVKSGKSFDLFLPARRQAELAAWFKHRLPGAH
jgi:hypothetical protein